MAEKRSKKPRSLFRRAMVLTVLLAVAAGAAAWFMQVRLEQGVLDVCAAQQDAYVQLVLDQINLQQNRDDREIIDDILETMDASSSKYWVFSKGETMLFVKDVMETNKYKGFTTGTYYDSASAKEFLNSLRLNYVRHDSIQLGGKQYIASGVTFAYRGAEYRLCLLTNYSMILENNVYLRAKSGLWVVVLTLLALLVAAPAYFARRSDVLARRTREDGETIARLYRSLTAMNDRLANRDWYEPETSLWQSAALPQFARRMARRPFSCVTLVHLRCDSEEAQLFFLSKAGLTVPKTALRFSYGLHDLLLLFPNQEQHEAWECVVPLLGEHVALGRDMTTVRTAEELIRTADQWIQQEREG